jgi:hypothetical protein
MINGFVKRMKQGIGETANRGIGDFFFIMSPPLRFTVSPTQFLLASGAFYKAVEELD